MSEELTPMLRQYRAMRQELDGDALLLFRLVKPATGGGIAGRGGRTAG